MAVVTDMLEEPMSLAWWHTQQDLDLREKKKKKSTNERGYRSRKTWTRGTAQKMAKPVLSVLTCVGKTQDFWLFRLLSLMAIWDLRHFLSNLGGII
jgi:hypothetical protein